MREIEVSWVPRNRVKKYYHPKERMREIRQKGSQDSLEEKLLNLTSVLEEKAGVDNRIGVTGSILTETHKPDFSDIDLTVYGLDESYKLIEALRKLKENETIKGIKENTKKEWVESRTSRHGLSKKDLSRIADTRWNYGYFDGTYFSVHPTRKDEEIQENYGDNKYQRIAELCGSAVVTDSRESILLPAIYKIKDVADPEITEIVSFEGLYGSLLKEGDLVEYKGILEKVIGNNPHKRIIVGGAGSPDSYIRWATLR